MFTTTRFLFVAFFTSGFFATVSIAADSPPPAITTSAPGTMIVNHDSVELTDFIKTYAKASGKKIMVDPGVRGKITIYNPAPISLDEAYNQLGAALALNGYAISQRDDLLVIISGRNAQRSLIETFIELPPLKPERMVTWMIKLKYVNVEEINKRLRILPSKDGEMTPFEPTNTLIVSDYVSNIHRIAVLIKELDRPEGANFKPKTVSKPAMGKVVKPKETKPAEEEQPSFE